MTAARHHFIGSVGLTLAALALQCGTQPSVPAPSTPSNAAKASTALHDVESDFRSGTRLLAKVLRVAGTQEEAHIGWHDKDLATDCTFEPASDGAKRCLPTTRFETDAFFADAGCKTRVAVTFPSQPCTSRFARASEGHCDDFRERAFPAQDELRDIATVFQRDSDQRCTPKPLKGEHVFRLGAEIAASRFVEGRSSMEGGSASVMAEYVVTSDGARAFVTLRDPRHGRVILAPFAEEDGASSRPPSRFPLSVTLRTESRTYVGAVDGVLGPNTQAAIKDFQSDNPPLAVDGICGRETTAALVDAYGM
jgi:hypothetical protein